MDMHETEIMFFRLSPPFFLSILRLSLYLIVSLYTVVFITGAVWDGQWTCKRQKSLSSTFRLYIFLSLLRLSLSFSLSLYSVVFITGAVWAGHWICTRQKSLSSSFRLFFFLSLLRLSLLSLLSLFSRIYNRSSVRWTCTRQKSCSSTFRLPFFCHSWVCLFFLLICLLLCYLQEQCEMDKNILLPSFALFFLLLQIYLIFFS